MSSSQFIPLSARGTVSHGESSQGALKRKWRQSSSSGSYDGPVWTLERSRIGFPQPLPKLPVEISAITGASEQQLEIWRSCRDEARAVITEEGLDFKEIGVYLRKGAGELHPSPTLLVSLRGNLDQDLGKSALITIGHMLHEKNVKGLRVEIADPQAYRVEAIYPINDDHRLVKLWPRKIRALVLDLLEYVKFSELGVYRYGYTDETAVPTITITVKNSSYDIREELKAAIVQVCASHGVSGMRVAVIYDEAKMHDRDDGYLQGYQSYVKRPGMGQSIGTDNVGAGTMGGYLVLADHKNKIRRHVFLTCWHVLRPDDKNVLAGECSSITRSCSKADFSSL